MNKFNIALIEDSKSDAKRTIDLIEYYSNFFDLDVFISCFCDVSELKATSFSTYDFFIWDVEVGEINCVNYLNNIGFNRFSDSVFISNYESHVFNALKNAPFAFIRKSNLDEDLAYYYSRFLENRHNKEKKYYSQDGKNAIYLKNMIYVESFGNYIYIYTTHSTVKERLKLSEFIEKCNYDNFVKINRSIVINIFYLEKILSKEVQMKNEVILPIKLRNLKEIKQLLLMKMEVK